VHYNPFCLHLLDIQDPRLDVVLCFVESTTPAGRPLSKVGPSSTSSEKKGTHTHNGDQVGVEEADDDVVQDKGALWDVGEVGGFEAYLLADDDKEGAGPEDTYRVVSEMLLLCVALLRWLFE
jgi:hypothetical protein